MMCRMDPDYSVKPRYPILELSAVFHPKATNAINNKSSIPIVYLYYMYGSTQVRTGIFTMINKQELHFIHFVPL